MPKSFQRSITSYLAKMKNTSSNNVLFSPRSFSFSSGKGLIKSVCRHPRTSSFAIDANQEHAQESKDNVTNNKGNKDGCDESATLSDIDQFLLENFRSLYIGDEEEEDEKGKKDNKKKGIVESSNGSSDSSPRSQHELSLDRGGLRQFFMGPDGSSPMLEGGRLSLPTTFDDIGSSSESNETLLDSLELANELVENETMLPTDCIAVLKHSPSPYDDFRRSMQEIVEANLRTRAKLDWEFMEELLFCYLGLNDKKSYKFILSAFIDTMIVLRENSSHSKGRSRNLRIARERRRKILRFVK
ncbi:hypothetical protein ACFE04_003939 [Oxalis oulophora]